MTEPPVKQRTTARGSRRKAQLIDTSARLFQERGFHKVSMADIAGAVGITGPALYRHFRSKNDVLVAAVDLQLSGAESVAAEALEGPGDPEERLDAYFKSLAVQVLEVHEALLWTREQHHLGDDERKRFRTRLDRMHKQNVAALVAWRPDLAQEHAEVLAWALMSLFTRTREYRTANSRASTTQALTQAAWAIASCDLAAAPQAGSATEARHIPPANSRRERVLESATELFYRRGFDNVGVEDIADASQTAIATVYQLFEGKADILHAVLVRGSEGAAYVTAHRLARDTDGEEALRTVWSTYLELALGPHGRMLRILAHDLVSLEPEAQQSIRRSEREYVEEWLRALTEARPELSASDVAVKVISTITVLTEVTQISAVRRRPNCGGELGLLASQMLAA